MGVLAVAWVAGAVVVLGVLVAVAAVMAAVAEAWGLIVRICLERGEERGVAQVPGDRVAVRISVVQVDRHTARSGDARGFTNGQRHLGATVVVDQPLWSEKLVLGVALPRHWRRPERSQQCGSVQRRGQPHNAPQKHAHPGSAIASKLFLSMVLSMV